MNGRRRWIELALIAGVCILLFFFRLGAFGLVGADEPRYAQVAREMLERNDWVTPVLYGQPWLEKPIAFYWGAMMSFKMFGVSDAASRVPSALIATIMVLFVYAALGRIRPRARVDAALMVASGALVIGMARAASTDMMLSASFTVAMLAWFAWQAEAEPKRARLWLAIAYAALGVAMLAKGPIAVFLALLVIGAYAAARREPLLLLRTFWIPGILIFLAIAAPWFVLVQMRTPEFFRVFILNHNLGRFGSNMFRHKQPFWYYLPVVLLATAPWTFFVVTAVVDAARVWWRERQARESGDGFREFLVLWAVLPVAFFSISQSKLPGYILPAIPAFLILAAEWIHDRAERDERFPFWLAAFHGILMASLAAGLLMAPSLMLKQPATPQAMMLAGMFGSAVFVGVVLALFFRGWAMVRFATLVPLVLFISFILRVLAPVIDAGQSARPIAELLRKVNEQNLPVATMKVKRDVPFGLSFYRNQAPITYEPLEISPNERYTPGTPPDEAHVVVIREGAREELKARVAPRAILPIGYLHAQKAELYLVSAAR